MSESTTKLNEGMHLCKGKGRGQGVFRAKGCPKGLGICVLLPNCHIHPEPFQEAESTDTFASLLGWL